MKRISASVLALALTAAAGSAFAAYQGYDSRYDSRTDSRYDNGRYAPSAPRSDVAQVVRVDPIYDNYASSQRQECWNEQSSRYEDGYYRDSSGRLYRGGTDSNANGTLLGALIGGALGNQVGKGDGRKAATVGGAVIGGLVGNNIDRNNDGGYSNDRGYDQYRDNSGIVRRCRTVSDYGGNQRTYGYNVTYRYAGHTYHATTTRHPGRTMRVVVDVRPQDQGIAYRR